MAWTKLCDLSELKEGEGKYIQARDLQLAVFLYSGSVFVLDNYCPHAGANLAGGHIADVAGHACAVCPKHSWPFRLDTGELPDAPQVAVNTYPTRVTETAVEADL